MSYQPRSTAVKTKLLTVCKKCGQQNSNGYQYCTTCHNAHKQPMRRKMQSRIVQASPGQQSASPTSVPQTTLDIEEILQACGSGK